MDVLALNNILASQAHIYLDLAEDHGLYVSQYMRQDLKKLEQLLNDTKDVHISIYIIEEKMKVIWFSTIIHVSNLNLNIKRTLTKKEYVDYCLKHYESIKNLRYD